MRAFSISAEPWGPLPLLGRKENSRWTYYALSEWFELRIGEALSVLSGTVGRTYKLTPEEQRRIWELVSGAEESATKVADMIVKSEPSARSLLNVAPITNLEVELHELGPLGRLGLALSRDQALGILLSRLGRSW